MTNLPQNTTLIGINWVFGTIKCTPSTMVNWLVPKTLLAEELHTLTPYIICPVVASHRLSHFRWLKGIIKGELNQSLNESLLRSASGRSVWSRWMCFCCCLLHLNWMYVVVDFGTSIEWLQSAFQPQVIKQMKEKRMNRTWPPPPIDPKFDWRLHRSVDCQKICQFGGIRSPRQWNN